MESKINELANLIGLLENYYESIMSRIYLISQALEDSTAALNAINAAQGDKNEVENRLKQARLELNDLMKRSENVR